MICVYVHADVVQTRASTRIYSLSSCFLTVPIPWPPPGRTADPFDSYRRSAEAEHKTSYYTVLDVLFI